MTRLQSSLFVGILGALIVILTLNTFNPFSEAIINDTTVNNVTGIMCGIIVGLLFYGLRINELESVKREDMHSSVPMPKRRVYRDENGKLRRKKEDYLPTKQEIANNKVEVLKELLEDASRLDAIETLVLQARKNYKANVGFDHTRKPYETPLLWFVRLVDYASDKHEGEISPEALEYAQHITRTEFGLVDYYNHKLSQAEDETCRQVGSDSQTGNYKPAWFTPEDMDKIFPHTGFPGHFTVQIPEGKEEKYYYPGGHSLVRLQFQEMIGMVQAFHEMTGGHIGIEPALLDEKLNQLRLSLVAEEAREGHDAKTIVELADALGDMLYVVIGWVVAAGMQNKIYDCFCEIHSSNMSKACDTVEEGMLQRDVLFLATDPTTAPKSADRWAEVQLRGDKFVIVRWDGKVLKGNKYFEPNLNQFFEA